MLPWRRVCHRVDTVQVFSPGRIEGSPLRCYDLLAFPEEFSLHKDAAGSAPPDAFGSFRVLHQIGAGTLGPVFRAYDPERERLVAVKLFRLELPPEWVDRLAAALERLTVATPPHPAIAAPLASGVDGVTAYLAQEYVAAESLDVLLRQQKQASARDSLRVAAQLAGALDAAAEAGIYHGALHPRDVLVGPDETKLTGLGIAQALESARVTPPSRRPYTAPERVDGGDWDRRVDVHALAALVHEMLWGRRISGSGDDVAAALTDMTGGDLARLRDVFSRALAPDPAHRFDTALDFAEALTHAFATQAVSGQPSMGGAQPSAVGGRPPEASPQFASESRPVSNELTVDRGHQDAGAVDIAPLLPLEPLEDEPAADVTFTDTAVSRGPTVLPLAPPPARDLGLNLKEPAHAVQEPLLLSETGHSRSAIWPLAFALVIGVALGFAAGFGVGLRRSGALAEAPAAAAAGTAEATTGAASEPVDRASGAGPETPKPIEPRTVPTPSSDAPIVGSLLVRSTPAGAAVFVDGREYGRTPVTIEKLARGAHRLRVTRNGYSADERQVTISGGQRVQSLTVRLTPQRPIAPPARAAVPTPQGAASRTGRLVVESRPAGASVFINGQPVGTTPLELPSVPVGEHALHLELDGYQRWASAVRIVPAERNRVAASLDR